MLPLRGIVLSITPRLPAFGQLRYASSSSSTSWPASPHPKPIHSTFWSPIDGLAVNELANVTFFSMDRPLLDLYNEDHSKWEHTNNWTPSAYQPYHPPPTPDTTQKYATTSSDPESSSSSSTTTRTATTTTITLDITRVDGQLQVVSSEVIGQEQVADYLVAMQQRWEQQQRKRSLARKRYLLRKKGFFEKN